MLHKSGTNLINGLCLCGNKIKRNSNKGDNYVCCKTMLKGLYN